jgi:hypothetical protein
VTGAQPLQHRQVGLHGLELAADAAGPLEDHLAALGRGRPPPAANQQVGAELLFELANLLGHVGLDRRQRVGGGGERTLLGDGEQGVEMPKFHRHAPFAPSASIRMPDGCHRL